jgi:hypothetical protein
MDGLLLDRYSPEYDYVEKHRMIINATPEMAFKAAKSMDLSHSKLIALLFGIRNMYGKAFSVFNPNKNTIASIALNPTLDDLLKKTGFIFLDEDRDNEFVLGLVGKFWMPTAHIKKGLSSEEFLNFNEDGFAKACANFLITKRDDGSILLSTETRTKCIGLKAKSAFTLYWSAVRPFSGLTRRVMLSTVKAEAESETGTRTSQ